VSGRAGAAAQPSSCLVHAQPFGKKGGQLHLPNRSLAARGGRQISHTALQRCATGGCWLEALGLQQAGLQGAPMGLPCLLFLPTTRPINTPTHARLHTGGHPRHTHAAAQRPCWRPYCSSSSSAPRARGLPHAGRGAAAAAEAAAAAAPQPAAAWLPMCHGRRRRRCSRRPPMHATQRRGQSAVRQWPVPLAPPAPLLGHAPVPHRCAAAAAHPPTPHRPPNPRPTGGGGGTALLSSCASAWGRQ